MIIRAESVAGDSIERTIIDCIEFAKRNNCLVSININDVDMVISGQMDVKQLCKYHSLRTIGRGGFDVRGRAFSPIKL